VGAVIGGPLLVATLVEAYFQSFGFYREHYVIPKEKYGVLTPFRWQDLAVLVVFWLVASLCLYASYRLLKYAFGRPPTITT